MATMSYVVRAYLVGDNKVILAETETMQAAQMEMAAIIARLNGRNSGQFIETADGGYANSANILYIQTELR